MAAVKRLVIVSIIILGPLSYFAAYNVLIIILPPVLYVLGGASMIILAAGTIGMVWLFGQMLRTRVAELSNRRVISEAEAIKATAEARQAQVLVITAPRDHQLVIRDEDLNSYYRQLHLAPQSHVNGTIESPTPEQIQVYRDYHGQGRQRSEPLLIEAPAPPNELPLLPALDHADNILIVGGKGSGKTTLLQWLEAKRIGHQEIVVMDSHAEPAQWQGRMVGFGRNYDNIREEMIKELAELNRRHKLRAKGQKTYGATTCIIDEFTLLPVMLKDKFDFEVKTYSYPLLTEGRKVKMNCIWGIHSDRVEALGMKGAADLKENFDVVVHLKNVKGHRYAICDFGEGKEDIKYTHPGPFVYQRAPEKDPANRPKPTAEEREQLLIWWRLKQNGTLSGNRLHQTITGQTSNASTAQIQKLRDLVTKFGEDPGF